MKVMAYMCQQGDVPEFLYVNAEFKDLPAKVKSFIAGKEGRNCPYAVIKGFGLEGERKFKEQGFLSGGRTCKETEDSL